MLRQRSFFSDSSSDFGGVDPAQALRMDGFDAPSAPALGDRLRESGIQAAETAIAGLGLGARQYAENAAYPGLAASVYGSSAVAIFWSTSAPDCFAARSMASWSWVLLRP